MEGIANWSLNSKRRLKSYLCLTFLPDLCRFLLTMNFVAQHSILPLDTLTGPSWESKIWVISKIWERNHAFPILHSFVHNHCITHNPSASIPPPTCFNCKDNIYFNLSHSCLKMVYKRLFKNTTYSYNPAGLHFHEKQKWSKVTVMSEPWNKHIQLLFWE